MKVHSKTLKFSTFHHINTQHSIWIRFRPSTIKKKFFFFSANFQILVQNYSLEFKQCNKTINKQLKFQGKLMNMIIFFEIFFGFHNTGNSMDFIYYNLINSILKTKYSKFIQISVSIFNIILEQRNIYFYLYFDIN